MKKNKVYFFNDEIKIETVNKFKDMVSKMEAQDKDVKRVLVFTSQGGNPYQLNNLLILFNSFDKIVAGDFIGSAATDIFFSVPIEKRFCFHNSTFLFHFTRMIVGSEEGWMNKLNFLEHAKELDAVYYRSIMTLTKENIPYNKAKEIYENREVFNAYKIIELGLIKENNLVSLSDFFV